MINFQYRSCNCPPDCHREKYEIVSQQYGSLSLKNHHGLMPHFESNETVLSVDLFQDEDEVVVETDSPAYSR